MEFMQKRILSQMINIDKVAYKEVNFKSKLIEWSQKNRVKLDFVQVEQEKDKNGSPVFTYKVVIEGIEGGTGKGYSKKESQQIASKLTLEQLRKKPQYIDAVFAAKSNRTKMEEEPVQSVPVTEVKSDFIITKDSETEEKQVDVFCEKVYEETFQKDTEPKVEVKEEEEFDLSDISSTPKEMSKEDIIAAAEAAAFEEEGEK